MAIIDYCSICKKDTWHDGIANELGCSECNARQSEQIQQTKRGEFQDMILEDQLMYLFDRIEELS